MNRTLNEFRYRSNKKYQHQEPKEKFTLTMINQISKELLALDLRVLENYKKSVMDHKKLAEMTHFNHEADELEEIYFKLLKGIEIVEEKLESIILHLLTMIIKTKGDDK